MKTTEELVQRAASCGSGAEFPEYSADQRHDQVSCSRMDSEGCANRGNEDGGFRAQERVAVKLWDGTYILNSRLDVTAEKPGKFK